MTLSDVGPVEQNAYEMFSIVLFDVDTGGIPSADIDITGISAVLEKSTGGADFSSVGITQPTFLKAAGRVYCSYHFLTAEWAVGDLYRMTVGGITCIVNGQTIYVPTAVWSNVVLTEADIDTTVHAIDTSLGAQSDAATAADLSDVTTTSAQAKIRRLLLRIAPAALSAVINNSTDTDLGQMFADLATYFKAGGVAMDPTINAGSPTDISDCFDTLATYFKAGGAAMDPTINGASPTDISGCFDDLATYFKAAGAAFSATIGGGAATDVEAAFTALATLFNAASAAMDVTIDNGGSVRTNLNDIFNDVGAILDGAGITTFPASAVPGNGVSIAQVVRKIYDLVTAVAIEADVSTSLNTIVPATPTAGALTDILSKAAPGNTFDKSTDSLEAIADTMALDTTVAKATGLGTVFSVVKAVLQSTIVAAGIDLTLASTGGALELIGAYIQNGGTAFASGTSTAVAEIYTNNVRGSASFFTMSIVGGLLGTANCIVSEKNATSWTGVILESGKKVSIKATTEDFTSAGTADIYLIFRRLANGATISPA
jgi:hypothetical protein